MTTLEPKQEQMWAMRAGWRASYFFVLVLVSVSLVLGIAVVVGLKDTIDLKNGIPAVILLAAVVLELVMLMLVGNFLLLRGLFKPRGTYQLVPNVPLREFRKEIWLWVAYSFGFEVLMSVIMTVVNSGMHTQSGSNGGIATTISCICATQLIATRMVKKGKAHIELLSSAEVIQ